MSLAVAVGLEDTPVKDGCCGKNDYNNIDDNDNGQI